MIEALVGAACFVGALVGCEVVRRVAIARSLLDHANDRSLHTTPTPRLGGVPIVVATLGAVAFSWSSLDAGYRTLFLIAAGIALVGLRDDIKPLPASLRFLVQGAAAAAFVIVIGPPPLLVAPGFTLPLPGPVLIAVYVVWLVGVLNITNFMDGMDGLAGSQLAIAGAVFALLVPVASHGLGWAFAAASLGFLAHNYPPARIFLGDAGSTFAGFAFAGLALLAMRDGTPLPQTTLAIAPFLLDGTFTIFRRLSRREKIWQAHRSHLYQRAVQTGLAHREVLLVYIVWMVACGACALFATTSTSLVIGWAVAVAGLGAVWQWVGRLESDRPSVS